jgi:hypothetical protein
MNYISKLYSDVIFLKLKFVWDMKLLHWVQGTKSFKANSAFTVEVKPSNNTT